MQQQSNASHSGFGNPQTDHGFLNLAIPGRTDHIRSAPLSDSYVIPADVVSGLGEGNSLAGAKVLEHAFGVHATGQDMPDAEKSAPIDRSAPAEYRESGGATPSHRVDCLLAGGEYILHPAAVAQIGGGDVKRGHKVLDSWVVTQRKKIIKTMQGLKGPVRS